MNKNMGLLKKRNNSNSIIISVLTSLYRCEKHLNTYFKHVSEITNTDEVEFIFIHNDPTEKEKGIIKEHLAQNLTINYQYISVSREGLYKSWNRGIYVAEGEFVAVWNVDDVRYPESLKVQAEALKKNPEAGFVYGNRIKSYYGIDIKPELKITQNISLSSWNITFQDGAFVMWRKRMLFEVELFDEQFRIAGDADMWYRIASNYTVLKVEQTLGLFHKHDEALSSGGSNGEGFIIGMRHGFYKPSQFSSPITGLKSIKIRTIVNQWTEKKTGVLCYNSLFTYLFSCLNLIRFTISSLKRGFKNIQNNSNIFN